MVVNSKKQQNDTRTIAQSNTGLSDEMLEIFSSPQTTKQFYGNEKIIDDIRASIKAGNLHHSLLLSGTKGIGKSTAAYKIAQMIFSQQSLSEAGDEGDLHSRLISTDKHQDLKVLQRLVNKGKLAGNIVIDQVRELHDFILVKLPKSRSKVFIVDVAEDMNSNSANALLKMLEEPPPQCYFILISHNPWKILPTIKSRCRHYRFLALTDDNIEKILLEKRHKLEELDAKNSAVTINEPSWLKEIYEAESLASNSSDNKKLFSQPLEAVMPQIIRGNANCALFMHFLGGEKLVFIALRILNKELNATAKVKLVKQLSTNGNDNYYNFFTDALIKLIEQGAVNYALGEEGNQSELLAHCAASFASEKSDNSSEKNVMNNSTALNLLNIREELISLLEQEMSLRLDRAAVIYEIMEKINKIQSNN